MKRSTILLMLIGLSAQAASFPDLIKATATHLPKGGIVLVEQNGDAAPTISTAGTLEPADVPPDKIIFEIGSISKVFTGMLLAKAVIDKRVTLQSTLRDLMGAGQTFADPNVANITLLQLATHTSGLPRVPDDIATDIDLLDPYPRYTRQRLDTYLSTAKLPHSPPFATAYSNLGGGLLGDLLARIYGKSWEELISEHIARPLNLTDTCVTLTDEQKRRFAPPYAGPERVKPWNFAALAGAGALRSTAADMLRFAEALAHPANSPLKDIIELTEQPQSDGRIGLLLQITKLKNRTNAYWFQGGTGGFRSWISARPSDGRLVVILINNSSIEPAAILNGKIKPKP